MDAIQTLKAEHARCRTVIEAARRRLIEDPHPAAADIEDFVDFFRYFANTCHHPKEEDLLFAALHRRGLTWQGYPLNSLLATHQSLHVTLESAADWLPLLKRGDHAAIGPLIHNLRMYMERLTWHMDDEEQVVFPMAEYWLTADDKRALEDAFAAVCCEESCEDVHEFYGGLAKRLTAA